MGAFQQELESRYASLLSADGARFIVAKHVPDALLKLELIRPEDRLILFADDFQDAFIERFPRESLFFVQEPTVEAFAAALSTATAEGRTFWFVNAIGGRGLRVPDLRTLARVAHEIGVFLIVDNTVPSLFGCQPLALGADFCLEALDRVAAGELRQKTVAVTWCKQPSKTRDAKKTFSGGYTQPEFAVLASLIKDCCEWDSCDAADLAAIERGLDTLPARMQRHFDHARAIAEYLSCCDAIPSVSYPGLASHPDRSRAAGVLLHGYGPAIDFELSAHVTAEAFLGRCHLAGRAYPAGGSHTRMSARDGDDARFIRLFAGLDDPLAIADDLDQAMRWFCNPPEP